MSKSIIIIGAGFSGLAAGCYGQMNGFDTRIYEMNSKPGGLCSSWQRHNYTISCGPRWLEGTKRGSDFYKISVLLKTEFKKLHFVSVIANLQKTEQQNLEKQLQ